MTTIQRGEGKGVRYVENKRLTFTTYNSARRNFVKEHGAAEAIKKYVPEVEARYDREIDRLRARLGSGTTISDPKQLEKKIKSLEVQKTKDRNNLIQAIANDHYRVTGEYLDKIPVYTGESEYLTRMRALDGGKAYWSSDTEMFARVFESYIQDTMRANGSNNDYLVHGTKSSPLAPFPMGNERKMMHSAMEKLLKLIVSTGALKKALAADNAWKKSGNSGLTEFPKIIAVDFDGTLTSGQFPELGKPRGGARETLDWYRENGGTVIIWTCRTGKEAKEARDFLDRYKIRHDFFNENVPGLGFKTSRKIYADLYIDDRSYFPGWPELLNELQSVRGKIRKSVNTSDLIPGGGVPSEQVYSYLRQNYPADTIEWVKGLDWHYYPRVPLSKIKMSRRPGGRNMAKVEAIAQAVSEGKKMEPIVLVESKGGLEIADGYHRTLGFKHAGKKALPGFIAIGGAEGPWQREMHERKLNKSLGVQVVWTRKEANGQSKGSAITIDLYHGTSKDAAESIKQEGFRLSHLGENTTLAGVYGAGIYFTTKPEYARFYGKSVLTVRVNVKNPAYADDMVRVILGVKKKTGKDYAMGAVKDYSKSYGAEQLTEYLKDAGFDCLISVPKQFGIKNAPEIVIFDPKDILIVDEDIKVQKSADPFADLEKLLMKSGDKEEGRWITIHPHGTSGGGGEKDYRRIKLDSNGRIIGGDVPKDIHGEKLGQAFKPDKTKGERPKNTLSNKWYHPSQIIRVKASRTGSIKVNGTTIKSAQDVAEMFADLTDADREKVFVVAVKDDRAVGAQCVHIGAIAQSVANPKDMLKLPILAKASGLYILHNHPSGNPEPSKEDLQATRNVAAVAAKAGLTLYGHVVMGETYSLIDEDGFVRERNKQLNAAGKKGAELPVYETTQEKKNTAQKVSVRSTGDVIDYIKNSGLGSENSSYFLLLNTKFEVTGAIPFDPTKQRTDEIRKLAVHAMVNGNAARMVIATGSDKALSAIENIGLKESASQAGIGLLDVIVKQSSDKYASLGEYGKLDMFKSQETGLRYERRSQDDSESFKSKSRPASKFEREAGESGFHTATTNLRSKFQSRGIDQGVDSGAREPGFRKSEEGETKGDRKEKITPKGGEFMSLVKEALQDEQKGIAFYREILKAEGISDKDKRIILNILADEKRHAEVLQEMLTDMEKAVSKDRQAELKKEYLNEDGTFKSGFDGAVKYFMAEGYSEEVAKKIAGKIAAEKYGKSATGGKLAGIQARVGQIAQRYGIKIAG